MTRTFSPEAVRRRRRRAWARLGDGVAFVVGAAIITVALADLVAGSTDSVESAPMTWLVAVEVLTAMVGAAVVVLNAWALRMTDTSARRSYRRAATVTLVCAVAVVLALVAIAFFGSTPSDRFVVAAAGLAGVMPTAILLLAGATASAAWARSP